MFQEAIMKSQIRIASCIVLFNLPSLYAQTPQQEQMNPGVEEAPMEEIIVIGQRSIMNLRMQVDQAVDRMYAIYNEVNKDDDYDIICKREAPTGSLIKRKVCTPVFYSKEESRATQLAMDMDSRNGFMFFDYSVIPLKNKKLKENMKRLILENPSLFNAVVEQVKLSEELKRQRREYWGWDDDDLDGGDIEDE